MNTHILIMFMVTYFVVTLSPGPNVLLVIKNSVQFGWRSALITILGNLSCQLLIVILVAIGVGGVLSQFPAWFIVMKCIGGIYLIYLGLKNFHVRISNTSENTPEVVVESKRYSLISLFKQAFLVSASNPKTLIFLSAFLPQFLDVNYPKLEQFIIMYISICIIVMSVHLSYAVIVNNIGQKIKASNFEKKLEKITGSLFIIMGFGVVLSSKS